MTARILVVDDILVNVRLMEARLTAEYFDVHTATSGAEALAMLSPGIGVADRLFSVAGWASRHRLLVVGALAAGLAWSRPRRLFGLATRAWALWRGLHSLGGHFSGRESRERA